jgi:hypothetical protein
MLLESLYNFALEYTTIRKVQENQLRLKLNGTQQLPVGLYADDVNLLRDNRGATKTNPETEFGFCVLTVSSEPPPPFFFRLPPENVKIRIQSFSAGIDNSKPN